MITHTMTHIGELKEGSDLFHCSICQRLISIDFDKFKKIVLFKGESNVIHNGGIGGVSIDSNVYFNYELSDEIKDLLSKMNWGALWENPLSDEIDP